ncbi:MAG: sigma-70 family RNA polymerase sigma factor [Steroidobacteraceae bacterium]
MNDPRARFEAVVMPHLDAAYRFALGLARSPADAQDLVQDAFLRAFRGFDGLRGEARPWLLTIVRHCFLNTLEQRRRVAAVSLSDEEEAPTALQLPAGDEGPEEATIRADHRHKLEDLLGLLASEHREVLVLREIEELSYRDIASIAGLPIGTVMSRLARAREALKALWQRTHGEEPA